MIVNSPTNKAHLFSGQLSYDSVDEYDDDSESSYENEEGTKQRGFLNEGEENDHEDEEVEVEEEHEEEIEEKAGEEDTNKVDIGRLSVVTRGLSKLKDEGGEGEGEGGKNLEAGEEAGGDAAGGGGDGAVAGGQSPGQNDDDDDDDNEEYDADDLLSEKERERAELIFSISSYTKTENKGTCEEKEGRYMSVQQFGIALALLGQVLDEQSLKDLYKKSKKDAITCEEFITLLCHLRKENVSTDQIAKIEDAFNSMYRCLCESDNQIGGAGLGRFITSNQLRTVLTKYGAKMTDEEADELIRECRPIPDSANPFDQGSSRIYLPQYQSMLLDKGV